MSTQQVIVNIEPVYQYPNLPTGCEATACTMFINYLNNSSFTKEQIAEKLPKESDPHWDNEAKITVGGNPHRAFVGSPFSSSSFGVFHEPIYNFLKQEFSHLDVIDLSSNSTDADSEKILKNYLNNGKPIIIWMTLELKEPKETDRWKDEKERNTEIVWNSPEHCALLVGYNDLNFIVNDPHTGKTEIYSYYVGDKWDARQLVQRTNDK